MNKTKLFFATAIIAMIALTTNQLEAQESKILAGGGIAYATEINSAAIFAKGVYQINDEWEASLGINYYFPKGEGAYEIKWMGFDLDAHYVFSKTDDLDIYGIAGINILRVSIPSYDIYYGDSDYDFPYDEEPSTSTSSISDTNTGINLGMGARYLLTDNLYGLGEAKYAINNGGYLQLSVGVLFGF
ncbi:outer membrane beta-barrel protein [Algibacter sp. L4_22]|uniref:outer membrane beta-barrel protein n=1 Tax=Algibacter sp. L4_22 TaxID=2942477 RepID=UPI00201B9665|nr:outer membrane beta-barrel protein [Algibacter sp. L4_22]MCL5130331.1 outer membrane beta-barrel protein [Algibacter sp. L4_22]